MTTTLNITAAVTLKTQPGQVFKYSVLVAGVAGTINDCASTGTAAASNAVAPTPAVIGTYDISSFSFGTGITVTPGAGQTIAVAWQ